MRPASDSPAAAPPGWFPAWAGGAAAAVAAGGMAMLVPESVAGRMIHAQLPSIPVHAPGFLTAFFIAVGGGMAAALVGALVHPLRRAAGLLVVAALLMLSQSFVLGLYSIAWEPLPAMVAILAGGGLAALLNPGRKAAIAAPFRGRVGSRLLSRIAAMDDPALLRPDQRQATVVTCRLLNENALREILPARDFLKLCQSFRATASRVLLNMGACLDPTESSGVRAFFGLPLPAPAAADEAVTAALALEDAMHQFSGIGAVSAGASDLPENPSTAPVFGIGIASGQLTAGLVGTTYTVLGDAMELSRWLAAETANYEVRILMDSTTHYAAENVEDRPLEFVNPPDGAAVEIFQLLGTPGSLSIEALARRQAFRDAIMLLRAGHSGDALSRFADAREGLRGPDPVLEYFVSLAQDQSQRDAASNGHASPSPHSESLRSPGHTGQSNGLPPAAPLPPSAPGARRKTPPARKIPRRP